MPPLISERILKSEKVLQTETNLGFEPDEEMAENSEMTTVNAVSFFIHFFPCHFYKNIDWKTLYFIKTTSFNWINVLVIINIGRFAWKHW